MLTEREGVRADDQPPARGSVGGCIGSRSVSTAHLFEPPVLDRADEDDWRTSAEERDEWWHTDWAVGSDW